MIISPPPGVHLLPDNYHHGMRFRHYDYTQLSHHDTTQYAESEAMSNRQINWDSNCKISRIRTDLSCIHPLITVAPILHFSDHHAKMPTLK